MAFPSQNQKKTLDTTLTEVQQLAGQLKQRTEGFSQSMVSTDVPGLDIIRFGEALLVAKSKFQDAAAVPGLAAFAQEALEDQSLDIVAEFTAMIAAIDTVIAWMTINYPATSGFWHVYNDNGTQVVFTPTQTATLRQELNNLAATIV